MNTQGTSVRSWLGGLIRDRVVGDAADEAARAVFDAPGRRWFGPDRPIRKVHADASMFVGGLRALLLQSMHPLAMAGVAQHSDYRRDPWGRLQRTSSFLGATTFGPVAMAEQACDRVLAVHERVQGVAADGRSYSANDPHLLRWVHVCEVDSFLSAYRRYGSEPLSDIDADGYVSDMAKVARRLGVHHPPVTVSELRGEIDDFRQELRGTREARDAARFLLVEPPLPLAARGPYLLLAAAAVSLLPTWTRWPLRLPYLPISEAAVVRPAGDAITHIIRWSMAG